MKYAVISDIHGNFPALQNVLEDAAAHKVDEFIFIGDYIFDLPFSNEVVREIMKLKNAHVVAGNKEGYLKHFENQDRSAWVFEQMGAAYQTMRELPEAYWDYLMDMRPSASIPLESGGVIYAAHRFSDIADKDKTVCGSSEYHRRMLEKPFTHAQFLSEFEVLINGEEYARAIGKLDAPVVLFGHNHLQCHGYCGKKLVVNPGSCGQPIDFDNRAAYALLEETRGGLRVTERRVSYDIEETIRRARQTEVCQAGKIWCELVFLAMTTGRDYFGFFFGIARRIAASKNETGHLFSNETWRQAYLDFSARYGV